MYRNNFYSFNVRREEENRWILRTSLPCAMDSVGAITYGKNEFQWGDRLFKLEHVFVLARTCPTQANIFIYTFSLDTGASGTWETFQLGIPYNQLGHGASITFRPTNYIYWDPTLWCYVITLGELYFTQGNMTGNFYCLPIKQLFSPVVCDTAIACDWVFPPDNGVLDAMKIFFRWETIPNANYYYLQVDKNPDFSSPILDITTDKNIYNSKKIFSPGVYYWRICSDVSPIWDSAKKFQIIGPVIRKRAVPESLGVGGSIAYHRFKMREQDTTYAESIYCLIGGSRQRPRKHFYCYSVHKDSWFMVDSTRIGQKVGASLTSCYQGRHPYWKKRLLATLAPRDPDGTLPHHRIYHVPENEWYPSEDPIPHELGAGASITFDWEREDPYLVIGGGENNFLVYHRSSDEEEDSLTEGGQSLITNKIVFFYSSEKPSYGEISIYNLYGKKIKTLFRGKMEKKEYQLIWDKKDEKKFSPGIYFLIINTKEKKERIKIIITH
ncbi:MAG: T9SS type A sorting domain-containing protein [candidate division WOR-3 bacterium]